MQTHKHKPGLVLFCSSKAWGGLEQSVVQLAGWLLEEGIWVHILCAEGTKINEEGMRLGVAEAFPIPGKYLDFRTAWRLSHRLKELGNRPLLIPHNYDLDCAAWAHRLASGSFNLWYWQHMQLGLAKKGFFQRMRQSRLTGWLAPLEYLRQEAIEKTTVPEEKIHIMPPGVDVGRFDNPGVSKQESRHSLGLPTDVPMLGLIGRLDPRKGQEFAIRALALLPANVQLVLMGEPTRTATGPDYSDYLRELVRSQGVGERVQFLPFSADTRPFYLAVDVVLMCTDGETYGLVTVEALAAGRPVVGSASGGTVELLGGGQFGVLYHPADTESFVEQVRAVLADPNAAYQKAEAGRQFVKEYASRTLVLRRIRELVLHKSP